MNQIPDETVVSKGKLHYLIPDWKQKVKIQNIDKIKDFIEKNHTNFSKREDMILLMQHLESH